MEMIGMADPGMSGVVTRVWEQPTHLRNVEMPKTKKELLRRWDEVTEYIDAHWDIDSSRSVAGSGQSIWNVGRNHVLDHPVLHRQ
jgi:hypothetical protein